jgi:abortive infection bacteriophage resistance protein
MHGWVFFLVVPEMVSTYNKPHLSFQQQLELLKTRELEVTDGAPALAYLTRIGYYLLNV